MKINIPKVVMPVDLGEYAEELRGQMLHVWVNPPLEVLNEHAALVTPGTADATETGGLLAWYARIWSQGVSAETHWSVEELHTIEQQDPALLGWMISATWEARKAHTERKKKA
jgi:hypothetical protein